MLAAELLQYFNAWHTDLRNNLLLFIAYAGMTFFSIRAA